MNGVSVRYRLCGGDTDLSLQTDIAAGRPNLHTVDACLHMPVGEYGIPVRKRTFFQRKRDSLRLSGFKTDLLKSLQLFFRADHIFMRPRHIQLHNFLSGT